MIHAFARCKSHLLWGVFTSEKRMPGESGLDTLAAKLCIAFLFPVPITCYLGAVSERPSMLRGRICARVFS